MKQILMSGNIAVRAITQYSSFHTPLMSTDTSSVPHLIPSAGKVRNLSASLSPAPGVGKTVTLTLQINGNPTAMTVSFTGTDTDKTYDSDVAVAVNDKVDWKIVSDVGSITLDLQFEYESDTPNVVIITGASALVGLQDPGYLTPSGTLGYYTAEVARTIIPCAGTISDFHFNHASSPGTGRTWTITIRKNFGDPAGQSAIVYTNAETGNKDAAQTIAVSAGDIITILFDTSGGSVTHWGWGTWGIVFNPTADGDFFLSFNGQSNQLPGTLYLPVEGSTNSGGTRSKIFRSFNVKELWGYSSAAQGVGKTTVFKLQHYNTGTSTWDDIGGPGTVTLSNETGPLHTDGSLVTVAGDLYRIFAQETSGGTTSYVNHAVLCDFAGVSNKAGPLVNGPILRSLTRALVN